MLNDTCHMCSNTYIYTFNIYFTQEAVREIHSLRAYGNFGNVEGFLMKRWSASGS